MREENYVIGQCLSVPLSHSLSRAFPPFVLFIFFFVSVLRDDFFGLCLFMTSLFLTLLRPEVMKKYIKKIFYICYTDVYSKPNKKSTYAEPDKMFKEKIVDMFSLKLLINTKVWHHLQNSIMFYVRY